jgi:hypothetical protein
MKFLGNWGQALSHKLVSPVDGASLAAFRILFGALMVYETYRYFAFDRITRYYVRPSFHFTYEFFPMISPWPEPWIYLHFLAMGIFALGIMAGLFYRVSAYLFFLAYTYVFLLDKTEHNNHYYLIILLAFLLIMVDGHRVASLDRWWRGGGPRADQALIPFWNIFVLRAQIVIVYFYAGVAKLNADWLVGEPMRAWLYHRSDYALIGPFFTTEFAAYFFSYGGIFFDLSIGFLLLWRRTRLPAFVVLFFFHLMNKWLFSIGIFPYMMIATTILFVEPGWPRRWLGRAVADPPATWPGSRGPAPGWVSAFVGIYLAIQILVPLRHWLYPGEVSWTEEGHRFSWHMKLRSKQASLIFFVTDPKTGQTGQLDTSSLLTPRQFSKMSTRPDMIRQFVAYLKEQLETSGQVEAPIIRVEAWVSLNGRPVQRFIDQNVNLAAEPYGLFDHGDWIIPLRYDVRGVALAEP